MKLPVTFLCKHTGQSRTVNRSPQHDVMYMCPCAKGTYLRSSVRKHYLGCTVVEDLFNPKVQETGDTIHPTPQTSSSVHPQTAKSSHAAPDVVPMFHTDGDEGEEDDGDDDLFAGSWDVVPAGSSVLSEKLALEQKRISTEQQRMGDCVQELFSGQQLSRTLPRTLAMLVMRAMRAMRAIRWCSRVKERDVIVLPRIHHTEPTCQRFRVHCIMQAGRREANYQLCGHSCNGSIEWRYGYKTHHKDVLEVGLPEYV
ncbi:hypothetical protein B0O80DRAFT_10974 [Mortierella sp. GBAus27b]|nr:hypothetical protein B0O80DRAFT_10974 [Mortierella sp. GBAus27b]